MKNSGDLALFQSSLGPSIRERLSQIQPHEVLIFFILLILLALCLFIADVIRDVDIQPTPSGAKK